MHIIFLKKNEICKVVLNSSDLKKLPKAFFVGDEENISHK